MLDWAQSTDVDLGFSDEKGAKLINKFYLSGYMGKSDYTITSEHKIIWRQLGYRTILFMIVYGVLTMLIFAWLIKGVK